MEGVEFEETQQLNSFNNKNMNSQNKFGLTTRMFIKIGLAKDQKQANIVMFIFSILCLVLMTYFIISTYFPSLLNFSTPNTSNVQDDFNTNQ